MQYKTESSISKVKELLFSRDNYNKEEILEDGLAIFSQILAYLATPVNGIPDLPGLDWNLESFRFMEGDPSKVEDAISQLGNNLTTIFPDMGVSVSSNMRDDSATGATILEIIINIQHSFAGVIDTSKLDQPFEQWVSLRRL